MSAREPPGSAALGADASEEIGRADSEIVRSAQGDFDYLLGDWEFTAKSRGLRLISQDSLIEFRPDEPSCVRKPTLHILAERLQPLREHSCVSTCAVVTAILPPMLIVRCGTARAA